MADARRVALEYVVRNAVNYREIARQFLGITFLVLGEPHRQRFQRALRASAARRSRL